MGMCWTLTSVAQSTVFLWTWVLIFVCCFFFVFFYKCDLSLGLSGSVILPSVRSHECCVQVSLEFLLLSSQHYVVQATWIFVFSQIKTFLFFYLLA